MKDIFNEVPEIFETTEQTKQRIINSARIAVNELIKVIEEPIITGDINDPTAEKMKSAVQSKKIAVFDCFEILQRIDMEELNLKEGTDSQSTEGFAERFSKGK